MPPEKVFQKLQTLMWGSVFGARKAAMLMFPLHRDWLEAYPFWF